MEENQVSFQFTARYFKLPVSGIIKEVWFVLHGYGQLAQYFIRKFSVLQANNICVIAPEGLSRFYLENFQEGKARANDRVGATWMTKENRLMDIENYINYLDEVYKYEIKEQNIPVTILGFSQGAATASRWALNSGIKYNRLILWSGIFPTNMDLAMAKESLFDKDVIVAYGNQDPFLNEQRSNELKLITDKLSIPYQLIKFDGGHEIKEETLRRIISE